MSHPEDEPLLKSTSGQAPASQFFAPPPQPVGVEFGAISHPGKVRNSNEDHYLIYRRRWAREVLRSNLPDGLLPDDEDLAYTIVVADGMGGRAFGELASLLSLRTLWALSRAQVRVNLQLASAGDDEIVERVNAFARLIHRTLIEEAKAEPGLAGMGTTMTAAHTVGRDALICHVGDSRAYLLRGGELTRLTRDHTVAQAMVEAGFVAPESPEAQVFGHVLTNCLGGSETEEVSVEIRRLRLEDGDRLMLCTDGLTDLVTDLEAAQTIGQHPEPDDACRALLDLALDHGGRDNVTVVLARYAIPDEPPDGDVAAGPPSEPQQ